MPVLEIENLDSGYGEVQILWDVSLSLEKGKLTALVGGNGVGKSQSPIHASPFARSFLI